MSETLSLQIRRLTISDEDAFLEALKSWTADPGFVFARGYSPERSFANYLQVLADGESGKNLPPSFVPDTSLFGFHKNEIVGKVAIRHRLNEFLLNVGGHIGYGVLPHFRNRGFATQLLAAGLIEAKRIGISKVLVTCDDTNVASVRVIEKNGGVLENKIETGPGLQLKRRYWISL